MLCESLSKIRFVLISYFDPGIILRHFSDRKSNFRDRNIEFSQVFANFVDRKIDFLIEQFIFLLKTKQKKQNMENTAKKLEKNL